MSANGRKRNAGFTIVETLLGTGLIVLVLASTLDFVVRDSVQSRSTRQLVLATNAARATLEEVRSMDFQDIVNTYVPAGQGPDYPEDPDYGDSPGDPYGQVGPNPFIVEGLKGPNGAPAGSVLVDATNPALLDVTVTITWQNFKRTRSVAVSTLMANRF